MCGVVGFWQSTGVPDKAVVDAMSRKIRHRGPDDSGVWIDNSAGLAFGHQRLSIIDLTAAGHQPMISPCERYVIVFNGEIYNHNELRGDLEAEGGHFEWRGHSDTETLLASLRHWGVENTLKRVNGMFAFGFWDRQEKRLVLARDRMGEKPLYYGRNGNAFLFGSELRALSGHPEWQGNIDRQSLTLYLRFNYVPVPRSIYKNIYKLPPAHYLVVNDEGRTVSAPICYWDLNAISEAGNKNEFDNPIQVIDELHELLSDSVRMRMLSDVPLGAFLSGGLDSSTIVSLMQRHSAQPVKTFTIGFEEAGYNEAENAKAIARHLGTEHTELYMTANDALAVIPQIPDIWDEPFSDSSQIPTYLVSKMAREHVKVCLSGDGGDELFCGYLRYTQGYGLWRRLKGLPLTVRNLGRVLCLLTARLHPDSLVSGFPDKYRIPNLEDKLLSLANVLQHNSEQQLYLALVSHWGQPDQLVLDAHEPETLLSEPGRVPEFRDFRKRMMFMDSMSYLPDDILVKVDRSSMAVGLEARVPMLDHRLVEFSWRVPNSINYQNGKSKWPVRQILKNHLPDSLVDRPKMGFAIPLQSWLRGPLREWAGDLLSTDRLAAQGFMDATIIRKYWDEHQSGKHNWHYHLWDVLMFQAWLENNGK